MRLIQLRLTRPLFSTMQVLVFHILEATLVYDIGIVQYIVSPNSGVLTGANFNQDNRNSTEGMWVDYYRSVIKHTRDVIARTEALPERNNLRQMARIAQAYAFMVLTDAYGDIPYLEGGKGFTDQLVLPKIRHAAIDLP